LIKPGLSANPKDQHQVKEQIRKAISERTLEEWLEIFDQKDVCVEPVLAVSEMTQHPQTQARNMIVDVPKRDGSMQRQVGNPIKFSQCSPTYKHIGAALGDHTEEVLLEVGYDFSEIRALRESGVFG
jgi:alpha-methylacyl-CoA racemase